MRLIQQLNEDKQTNPDHQGRGGLRRRATMYDYFDSILGSFPIILKFGWIEPIVKYLFGIMK